MSSTAVWYQRAIPVAPDAVHWEQCRFGSHDPRPESPELLARSPVPDEVTCPFCLIILEVWHGSELRRLEVLEARRVARSEARKKAADKLRRRERLRTEREAKWDESRRCEARFWMRVADLPPVEILPPEPPKRRRPYGPDRRAYGIPDSARSRGRETNLREWERGLDAWPDVRTTETLEAIAELARDRAEDPAHWRDLR